MNHPTNDELLLLAYGELPRETAAVIESHAASCPVCRRELASLERARVALDLGIEPSRWPSRRWIPIALAAAAVVAGVLLSRPASQDARHGWSPTTEWSATAGYIAGGKAVMDIDAQLTRLEQERHYGSRE